MKHPSIGVLDRGGHGRTGLSSSRAGASAPGGEVRAAASSLNEDIALAAAVDVPVLITATSRDARDMCARLIHASGPRWRGPFVTYQPRSGRDHDGGSSKLRRLHERAREGTLFIDDVAALSTRVQHQLSTLLDERACAGGTSGPAGVRLIAGAGDRLLDARAAEAFSEYLFYRLNVIHIEYADAQMPG